MQNSKRTRTALMTAGTTLAIAGTLVMVMASESQAQTHRGGPVTLPPDLGDIKTPPPASFPKEPISPERAAALNRPQLVGPPAPPKPGVAATASRHIDFSTVMYDVAPDGSLWALGRTYKAQFSADGFTYIPFLGSDAPQNYPVKFILQGVDSGGKALSFHNAAPTRDGDRIVIDRGLVQEVYLLTPDSIEQQFIFASKPGAGEVNLRMALESELAPSDSGDLVRFENSLGGITYTEAVTIDAVGRATDSPTKLVDGHTIEITLPESLVRDAAYPMTVDPMINTFVVNATAGATPDRTPDVAYDATDDGYLIVWERLFSATDHDVFSERYEYDGDLVASSIVSIDVSSANWRRPRVANNNFNDNYLVVAEVGADGARQVWGRTRSANSNTVGVQTQISDGTFFGDQFNADVGGDPFTGGGDLYYCVVWERTFSATDHDILARLATPSTGAPSGGVILIENTGGTLYRNPCISNSNNSGSWNVVYQLDVAGSDSDIYGARIGFAGGINTPNFPIDITGVDNRNPAVSGNVGVNFMAVYEEDPAGFGDLYARVYSGSTLMGGTNLIFLEDVENSIARRRPSVDSNADQFFVTSTQAFSASDWDPYMSVYCYTGSIRVSEQHRNLDYTGSDTVDVKVASLFSSGGIAAPNEFMPVWDLRGATGYGEIKGSYSVARTSCCIADIAFPTGVIDVSDLLVVITSWGACPFTNNALGICPGDINGDRTVNVTDLLLVITSWGFCP